MFSISRQKRRQLKVGAFHLPLPTRDQTEPLHTIHEITRTPEEVQIRRILAHKQVAQQLQQRRERIQRRLRRHAEAVHRQRLACKAELVEFFRPKCKSASSSVESTSTSTPSDDDPGNLRNVEVVLKDICMPDSDYQHDREAMLADLKQAKVGGNTIQAQQTQWQ